MKKNYLLKIAVFFYCFFIVFAFKVKAQTSIPAGLVSGTWTIAGSPYLIQGSIQIDNGMTLTIQPGVSVIFQGSFKLNVQGRLLAIGTPNDTITFISADTTNGWLGIRFDQTPATNDSSKLKYCKIQYGRHSSWSYPQGGALFFNNFSKAIVSYCLISNCKTFTEGGGIYINGCSPIISFNTITNNIAANGYNGSGAGISCINSSSLINKNTISYNRFMDTSPGGGIYISGGNPTLSNNIISNNMALNNPGGGICISSSNPQIINNIISNNFAASAGGIYCVSSDGAAFINNTIVNNDVSYVSPVSGGGIGINSCSPTFKNCILWGNTTMTSGHQIYLENENADPNFHNCDIQGGTAAFELNGNIYTGIYQNNINLNPLFVAPSAGSGTGFNGITADWSLQNSSPCINTGDIYANFPTLDITGNTRLVGCSFDLGAYENQIVGFSPISITSHPIDKYVLKGELVSFSVTASCPANQHYKWQHNGVDISNSDTSILVLFPTLADSGNYRCIIYNSLSSDTSNYAYLTVHPIPIIYSFSPSSGNVGTTVVISGAYFNETACNNIVYFGPTKAIVTARTDTSLTVIVPIGAKNDLISVLDIVLGVTTYSPLSFIPTYSCGGIITQNSFNNKTTTLLGIELRQTTSGDYDGDGKPDVAIATGWNGGFYFLKNSSASDSIIFTNGTSFASAGGCIHSIETADFDGDGKLDIVTCNYNSSVTVFINTSTPGYISFSNGITYNSLNDAGNNAQYLTVGDINNDGKPDILIANNGFQSNIKILSNTSTPGNISFDTQIKLSTGNYSQYLAIGDLDGDKNPDIVVSNYISNSISIFRNISSSSGIAFAPMVNYITESGPFDVHINDIDNDSKPEIIVAHGGSNSISVYKNSCSIGAISFSPRINFNTIGGGCIFASINDIDGDSKPDIISSNGTVLKNTSSANTISFALSVNFNIGSDYGLEIVDFNGDAKPDIFTTNLGQQSYSILKNKIIEPRITSQSSDTIYSGEKINIPFTCGINVTYSWIATNNPNTTGESIITQNSDTLNNTIVNNTTSIQTVTYTVTPIPIVGSCPGITQTITITVFPLPKITSFAPVSGPVGTTVKIYGSGFDITPSKNIVYFGATKAVVSFASLDSLIVTVPDGATYQPISVTTNNLNLTAYSKHPFITTFSCGGNFNLNSFATKIDSITGDSPVGIAIGDLDGDGKADLVVTNSDNSYGNGNSISIYRNTSINNIVSFAAKATYYTGNYPWSVIIKDIDGDGKLDVSVANRNSYTISVFRNTSSAGNITFEPKVDVNSGCCDLVFLSVDDLDGDGKPDFVVPNQYGGNISVIKNIGYSGVISFDAPLQFPGGNSCTSIADLNDDLKSDIIAVSGNIITIYKNIGTNGNLSFTAITPIPGGGGGQISTGDIDGDGKIDIVSTGYLLRNTSTNGNISFASTTNNELSGNSISIGDLNGDGKPDLVVGNNNGANVLMNNCNIGNLSFASPISYLTGLNPYRIALGDIDGDSRSDIVTTNYYSNTFSVLKNQINVSPIMTNDTIKNICSFSSVNLGLSSDIASSYSWVANDNPNISGESITPKTSATINDTLINNTTSIQNVTYTVTPSSFAENCVGTPQIITISVKPTVGLSSAISGYETPCKGQNAVTYTLPLIANATSYQWTLPSGATGSSTTNSITVNYSASAISGNITVKGINSCGESNTSSLFVNVTPLPVSGLPPSIAACSTATLTANSGYTYLWSTGATTQSITVNQSGWYKCTLSNGSCSITDSTNVTLNNQYSYNCELRNDIQTSPTTYEFDIYLLNDNPCVPLEYASGAYGITINPAIKNGGIITASIIAGSSELVASQIPTGITFTASQNCIKIGARTAPAAGSGTIIPTTGNGVKVCRVRISNSVPFADASTTGLGWTFTATPYQSKVNAYINAVNTLLTANTTTHTTHHLINPLLVSNLTPPVSVTSNRNNFCADDTATITLTANGGSGTILRWYKDNCSGNSFASGTSITIPSPDSTTTYYARWEMGTYITNCASVTVNIVPVSIVSASISSDKDNICQGTSVTLTANIQNGGNTPLLEWYKNNQLQNGENGLTYTYNANTTESIYCKLTSNLAGCLNSPSVNSNVVFVNVSNPPKYSHIKLYLEGFYNTAIHQMNPAMNETSVQFNETTTDTIQIQLAEATYPYLNSFSFGALLKTDGRLAFDVPCYLSGNYFLIIKHHNHIVTWSALPVFFGTDTVTYNFTTDATKASGDNQKLMEPGVYAFFAGDVNQDGLVDGSDIYETETDNNNFVTGYFITDVNGDGLVDGSDMNMVETNNNAFVYVAEPYPTTATLTTDSVTSISTTTVKVYSNVIYDGSNTVTQRGICWSASPNPSIALTTKISDGLSIGTYTSTITGLTAGTTYYVRAYATNSAGTAYGNEISFSTLDFPVYDIDGNGYDTIHIGTQVWFKQNLKVTHYRNGSDIAYPGANITSWQNTWQNNTTGAYAWYNNDSIYYKNTYGALYNWYAVNTGNLCPTGWHVPSDIEWTTLITYLGGEAIAGGKLKEAGLAHWDSPNTGATNETSFTALPGGYRNFIGSFYGIGINGLWWSSTESNTYNAWNCYMYYEDSTVYRYYYDKPNGYSVRCLKGDLASLSTTNTTGITQTTAISGGNITSDGGLQVTARGICWSASPNPSIALTTKTSDGLSTGTYTSTITGLTAGTTYYVRAYATNAAGTVYGNEFNFTTVYKVIDIDGNAYDTVQIGTQVWLKQNLKTTKYRNGTAIVYPSTDNTAWQNNTSGAYAWYNNDSIYYKNTYGALYNWYAVNTGNLCPTGWHVPSDAEWSTLTTYLGGESIAGGKLKEAGLAHWNSPNTAATNVTGFTALPGGNRGDNGAYYGIGIYGYWYCSTEYDSSGAWDRCLYYINSNAFRWGNGKTEGISVRCLRD